MTEPVRLHTELVLDDGLLAGLPDKQIVLDQAVKAGRVAMAQVITMAAEAALKREMEQ